MTHALLLQITPREIGELSPILCLLLAFSSISYAIRGILRGRLVLGMGIVTFLAMILFAMNTIVYVVGSMDRNSWTLASLSICGGFSIVCLSLSYYYDARAIHILSIVIVTVFTSLLMGFMFGFVAGLTFFALYFGGRVICMHHAGKGMPKHRMV